MIREAIEKVVDLATKGYRKSVITLDDGSKRSFLYSDAESVYKPLDRVVVRYGGVSNMKSFVALVMEELRRRDNPLGDHATVYLMATGGRFSPDDRVGLDFFTYERTLHPQWELLFEQAGTYMDHPAFLRLLQALRPSIATQETVRSFRRVTFDERVKVLSQPQIVDGKNGASYEVEMEVKSGIARTALPTMLTVTLPFSRGSDVSYRLELDIDIQAIDKDGKRQLKFAILWPDKEGWLTDAITDECEAFREAVSAAKRLLILDDF